MATESSLSPKAESVDEDTIEVKRDPSNDVDRSDGFSSTHAGPIKHEPRGSATNSPALPPQKVKTSRSSSSSTVKSRGTSASSVDKKEIVDSSGEILVKMELVPPSKPSRSASQKAIPRSALLFDHLEDATMEAKRAFAVLDNCTYANKFLGYTEHAMECDCNEEWDSTSKRNNACGEDSDCINRATKMECVGDCGCGSACQNQRFQQRQYANVSVIKTEKKGYGLRTNLDLGSGDFIFEYIGEVINEPQFRRRMVQYDEEGIKHFYFMSLSKGEFVDATKKGNLGRFCNHSCSPNCYVDKWVVGDKLRMGIFAERKIKAGEELVFNYNVDRYGANPQPCYCGEPNCTGFIGGKTQTERATKLSAATIEALGIDDGDSWETTVAKRPRKKKTGEDDEDYVESVEAKSLDTDGVTKVMAALMQCKEKWIAVKLLQRIQKCDDEVRNRVVKMHGYQILNSQLAAWKEDVNVVLQILDILDNFPRLTRNKIVDSKIESTLQPFTTNDDERVSSQAIALLDQWSKLEVAYRIPRKKRDVKESATPQKLETRYERRESAHERKRSRSRSRSRTPPRGPSTSSAPSGPRSSLPQRSNNFYPPRPPPFHRPVGVLPRGWFQASDNGKTYYYSADGQTTWIRPTQPASQPPPPPKQPSSQDVLKNIIDNIVSAKEKERDVKTTTPDTPQAPTKEKKEKKEDKWKSYDEGKKRKLYENTLFPHISHVMNKYKNKIPREDLKRFAKEVAKKLVESDFKGGRVEDPTKINEKHQQKVKKFCKDFFEKAAYKHSKHEKEKAVRKAKSANEAKTDDAGMSTATWIAKSPTQNLDASPKMKAEKEDGSDDDDVKMSEDEADEDEKSTPASPSAYMQNGDSLKRKRPHSEDREVKDEEDLTKSPLKKLNLDSPPPPPPPPPAPLMETPDGTPGESEDVSPVDTELHAETSFKSKSMADVLAEAQQDTGDDADVSMEDADSTCRIGLKKNGLRHEEDMLENLMVDGQVQGEIVET